MSNVTSKLNLTQVGRVCVTVADTDRAIDFYVGKLGFEKVVDVPMGEAMRWVEVALGRPGAADVLAARSGRERAHHRRAVCLALMRARPARCPPVAHAATDSRSSPE